MFARSLFLGFILTALMVTPAFAEGGFYGSVTYKNCDCTFAGDKVVIRNDATTETYRCGVDCLREGYHTGGCPPYTFPPGQYTLWVDTDQENCWSIPKTVQHGTEWQEVNLVVYGPAPTPRGPGED